jgi:hypothetical protein
MAQPALGRDAGAFLVYLGDAAFADAAISCANWETSLNGSRRGIRSYPWPAIVGKVFTPNVDPLWRLCGCACPTRWLRLGAVESASETASMDANLAQQCGHRHPEARRPAMSQVDRHAMGMLSSVMRALTHMEAHALRGQRPASRSSAAAVGSAIGVAMRPVVQPAAVQQASPPATPRTRRTVSPADPVRGISGFGPLF